MCTCIDARPALRRGAGGFSLPELIIFIVIFTFALAGILLVINTTVAQSAEPMVRKQSMAVAESMMEEVLLMPFAAGGWTGGATQGDRAHFDDVRDFNGYDSINAVYRVEDPAGTPTTGLNGFRVRVDVAVTTLSGAPALRVTVQVTDPRGINYALEGYKLV
jgi:MSHA pilin protein MshD